MSQLPESPAVAPSIQNSESAGSPADNAASRLSELLTVSAAMLADSANTAVLLKHGEEALIAWDTAVPIIAADNIDIQELLKDTREELCEAYLSVVLGRVRMAFSMLRGVMEGLYTALYYRQQSISLYLWASGKSFNMVHQLLEEKHEFYKYYKELFEDERFRRERPGVTCKQIFKEAIDTYDFLSSFVHKKSPAVRRTLSINFQESVERVFRIFFAFLEREEELPALTFPVPLTFPSATRSASGVPR